jgi:flavodoxin
MGRAENRAWETKTMEILIVYDSKFGNTRKLSEAIAEALVPYGNVRVHGLDDLLPDDFGPTDLLIVGGPTQRHGMSARMRQFTDALATAGTGMVAAVFDTRYRMPTLISGSAARGIAKRLRLAGIHVLTPPESFFVSRGPVPQLEEGEAERAASWARNAAIRCWLSNWCAA